MKLLLVQPNIISDLSRIGALNGFLGRLASGGITIFRTRNLFSACRPSIKNFPSLIDDEDIVMEYMSW